MTIVAGKGPLPSGVTRRPEACSSPLFHVTICSPAGAVAATDERENRESPDLLHVRPPQCAGAGAGAGGACFCSSERRRRSAAVITSISKATKPPTYQ